MLFKVKDCMRERWRVRIVRFVRRYFLLWVVVVVVLGLLGECGERTVGFVVERREGMAINWGAVAAMSALDAADLGRWQRQRMGREGRAQFEWEAGPGLMARVEGAKAAGIHPLVALGGGMGGSSIVGGGGGGSPVPISEDRVDPDIARYNSARADLAELEVVAQRRLASQPGNQGGGMVMDVSKVVPSEITSAARGIPFRTAGPAGPFGTDYVYRNPFTGEPVVGQLPSKDVSEPLEGMGEFWKAIIGTPMGGRFLWDAMVPDSAKSWLFDLHDRMKEPSEFGHRGAYRGSRRFR